MTIASSPSETLKVSRDDRGFTADVLKNPLETHVRTASGVIDRSLFEAVAAAGAHDQTAIFAREILQRLQARLDREAQARAEAKTRAARAEPAGLPNVDRVLSKPPKLRELRAALGELGASPAPVKPR